MLTIAVEFLGHYLFAHSSAEFLAVYNVARGQIWILVLMTMPAVVYGGHLGRAEMSSAGARGQVR
jgi:hypothetical protein